MTVIKTTLVSAISSMLLGAALMIAGVGTAAAIGYEDARISSEFHLAQSGDLKSRSEVIREVKRRYRAEVLRISFDEARKVYRVRVLMPNGKVRNLTVSARR